MKHIILILISILLVNVAYADADYEYKEVKPGQVYVNTSGQSQVLVVDKSQQVQKTKYEKVKDGYYRTINLANDLYNGINVVRGMFGI